uniref:Uncharacterized protein n=1 Tax=Romanomermis culicivorax TaxID=13658 RepID=A0A915KXD3_ROMCU
MQIGKWDDQQHRHLHRNRAPQKEENDNLIFHLERRAKGPAPRLLMPSNRKTFTGILRNHNRLKHIGA